MQLPSFEFRLLLPPLLGVLSFCSQLTVVIAGSLEVLVVLNSMRVNAVASVCLVQKRHFDSVTVLCPQDGTCTDVDKYFTDTESVNQGKRKNGAVSPIGQDVPKNPKCSYSAVLRFLMVKVLSVYSRNSTFLYFPPMCPFSLLKYASDALWEGKVGDGKQEKAKTGTTMMTEGEGEDVNSMETETRCKIFSESGPSSDDWRFWCVRVSELHREMGFLSSL